MYVAGLAISFGGLAPLACGPVETAESRPEVVEQAPVLDSQEQESFGGDLGTQLGLPVVTGNTTGKTNDATPTCAGSTLTPDLSYTWTVPGVVGGPARTFDFTTQGSAIDTVLQIHPLNNSAGALCNDDEPNGGIWSALSPTLSPGATYVITVESYKNATGAIALNITSPGLDCPSGCSQSTNNCRESTGTCQDGACVYPFKPLGASCDDGNFCTTGEICNGSGVCGGSTPRTCNTPPSQCHEATGTCSNNQCNYAPKAAGVACNDGNACTLNDTCNGAGACGGSAMQCNNPPGQCYVGTCVNGGCSYVPAAAGTFCNDGLSCTNSDRCNGAGECGGTSTCTGRVACSIRVCTPNGCELESLCMEGEYCSGGQCRSP